MVEPMQPAAIRSPSSSTALDYPLKPGLPGVGPALRRGTFEERAGARR